jgi:steroid delta-isomerase-like uncharacterized protein
MTDALSITQKYFEAWNRHDGGGIVATFAEGGSYTDPLAPTLTGEAIVAYARRLWEAFPDLSFEIAGATLAGNGLVATQWLMKGTNTGLFQGLPPSGRSVALPGADFIQIEGDKICSVKGYFDAGEVPRQLGLQILVQPYALGPFRFGMATAVQSGKRNKPGAFSITSIQARSEREVEQLGEYGRQIAEEMLKMPGFLGWTGMVIGDRLLTVTAWDNPESPRQLTREGTHLQAMKEFFGPEIAAGGYTSVWAPKRINATWVRCTQCGRMADYERANGQCECGQALPELPPYW